MPESPSSQSTSNPVEAFARLFQPPSERVRTAFTESLAAHASATAELFQGMAAVQGEPLKALGLLGEYCSTAGDRVLRFNQVVIDEWRDGATPAPAARSALATEMASAAPAARSAPATEMASAAPGARSALATETASAAPAARSAPATETAPPAAASAVTAYCVRCKVKRVVADPVQTTMKNGRAALKGRCSVCGSGVFKIGGG